MAWLRAPRLTALLALALGPAWHGPGGQAFGSPARPEPKPQASASAEATAPETPGIEFSGYRWLVIDQKEKRGPGPNVFDGRNVSLDAEGRLTLETSRRGGRWTSAHVFLTESLGYGRYELRLAAQEKPLDRRAVFGFFTWDDDPAFANREIDIELARWDAPSAANLHYSVQPSESRPERSAAIEFDFSAPVTLSFEWRPGSVRFSAVSDRGIFQWEFADAQAGAAPFGVPPRGNERLGLNLWLFRGRAPESPSRIVIESFSFTPAALAE